MKSNIHYALAVVLAIANPHLRSSIFPYLVNYHLPDIMRIEQYADNENSPTSYPYVET